MLNWCSHCQKNTDVRKDNQFLSCTPCGKIIDQSENSGYQATSLASDYSDQSSFFVPKKKGSPTPKLLRDVEVEESSKPTKPIFNDCIGRKLDKLIDVVTEFVEREKADIDNGLTDEVGEALDELKNAGDISGEVYNAAIVRIADSMGMKKMFLRMNLEDQVSFINFLAN